MTDLKQVDQFIQETLEEQQVDGTQQVIDVVQKRRKEGVDALEDAIDVLKGYVDNSDDYQVQIKDALNGCLTALEALNSLGDMLTSDLVNVIKNMHQISASVMQVGGSVEVMLQALVRNGVLTEGQIREAFAQLKQEAETSTTPPQPAQ